MIPPFQELRAAIENHQSFLIAAHVGPDGDAIGSGLALRFALESLGKEAWVVSSDGVPQSCRFLPQWQSVLGAPTKVSQCAIILDCNGQPNRVAAPYQFVERAAFRVLIDHHRTTEPVFDVNWIDASQPATAQMLYNLLRELSIPISADIAQCLFCGLSTDTGHFRFPNTTPERLATAGHLVESGADLAQVAFKLFDERSFESTKLLGIALHNMVSDCDGKLTWTALGAEDFGRAQSGDEGTENIVNILRNVRGARMAVILRERTDETGPVTRVSVRSESELRADLFCAQFGGGGHAAAAGFRVRYKSFAQSVEQVVEAARQWLKTYEANPPTDG